MKGKNYCTDEFMTCKEYLRRTGLKETERGQSCYSVFKVDTWRKCWEDTSSKTIHRGWLQQL